MPEFNRVFSEGKMNRDLDERLVPQGQYREGINVEVISSDNGNVGSVKNRKGNTQVAQNGLTLPGNDLYGLSPQAECVSYIIAEETQRVYYFIKNAKFDDGSGIASVDSDVIAEYDPNSGSSRTIFVDVRKIRITNEITGGTFNVSPDQLNVLNFQYAGVFGIDNMPIQTFRPGMTLADGNVVKKFSNFGGVYSLVFANPVDLADITANDLVLTKKSVLGIDRSNKYIACNYVDGLLFFTNGVDEPKKINIEESFNGTSQSQSLNKHTALITDLTVGTNLTVEEEHVTVIRKNPDGILNVTLDTQIGTINGGSVTNVVVGFNDGSGNAQLGHFIDFNAVPTVVQPAGSTYNFVTTDIHGFKEGQTLDFVGSNNAFPIEPIEILVESVTGPTSFVGSLATQLQSAASNEPNFIAIGNEGGEGDTNQDLFVANISLDKSLHEDKFVRFSYRWRYRDGEYSGFAPFTNVCFLPGAYDFSAQQGENEGVVNKAKQIILKDFVPSYIPKDVVEIELLFKEENLGTVYSVRKFNISDSEAQKIGTGSHRGVYSADAETFSKAISPNQILRPFDQVPRSAKAQEISANRVIYGNIKENYNLTSDNDNVNADISTGISSEEFETIQITQSNNFTATGISVFSQDQIAFENANDFTGGLFAGGPLYPNDLIFGFGGDNPQNPTPSIIQPLESDYNYVVSNFFNNFDEPATVTELPLRGAFVDDNEGPDVVTDDELDGNFNKYPGGFGVGTEDITLGDGVYHAVTNGEHIINFSVGARGEVVAGGIDPQGNIIPDASNVGFFGQWGEVLNDKNQVLPLRLAVQKLDANGNFQTIHAEPFRAWKPISLGFPNQDTESISNENNTEGYNDSVVRFIYHSDFAGYPASKPSTRTLKSYWGPPYNPDLFNNNPIWNSPNDWTDPTWIQNNVFGGGLSDKGLEVILAGNYDGLQFGVTEADIAGVSTGGYVANIYKQRLDFFWKAEFHDTKIAQPNPQYKLTNVSVNLVATDKIRIVLQRDPQLIKKFGDANCKIRLQNWSYNFKSSNEELCQLNLIPWFNPLYTPGASFNMISAPQLQLGNIYPNQAQDFASNNIVTVNSDDSFAKWLQIYFETENAPLAPLLNTDNFTDFYLASASYPAQVYPNLPLSVPGATGGRNTTWNQQMDIGFGQILEANRFTNRWDITQTFQTDGDGNPVAGLQKTFVQAEGAYHAVTPNVFDTNDINNLRIQLQLDGPDANINALLPNNIGRSSIKSFRTYKVGVVYRDEFGRETPVLPSSNNIVLNNNASDTINSFSFTCNNNAPDFADSYKFFIKENSSEYYNLVIDRIYDGGDSTVWVAFSSTDRNKVTEDTILIFKKQHNNDYMAHADFADANNNVVNNNPNLEYPILAISNEAPPKVLDQAGVTQDFDNLSDEAEIEKVQGKFFVKVKLDDAFKKNVIGDVGNNGIYTDLSSKPGVFETKPVENKDLDIYYEISQAFPIKLTQKNVGKFIQPGAVITASFFSNEDSNIFFDGSADATTQAGFDAIFPALNDPFNLGINGLHNNTVSSVVGSFTEGTGQNSDFCEIKLNNLARTWSAAFPTPSPTPGSRLILTFKNPNGTTVTSDVVVFNTNLSTSIFINPFTHPTSNSSHKSTIKFLWFNCFAFANGVESNRIRDRFNQPFISNGVKASIEFEEYAEEVNKNKLIFSGIYNSKSSVNKTNQFIIGEGITKDLNPDYGQIQRLLTRDTDLITFCEDKVLRILSNKDALFNADGNTNVVASKNVLGTATPFVGEYGISHHPESLAKYGYRVYFTDVKRGKVLRLSMDGITPISDYGMSDFFFDTFNQVDKDSKVIGSYDNASGEYNLTVPVVSNTTSNSYGYVNSIDDYIAPTFSDDIGGYTISFDESNNGWSSFRTYAKEAGFSVNDDYYTFKNGKIWHHQQNPLRNNYYGQQFNCSIRFIFNDASNIVKSFRTVNYEGTQAKIYESLTNNEYYDNAAKDGWYVERISTDIQSGQVINFRNKENKWHKYITGAANSTLDLSELSAQGFGLPAGAQLGDDTNGNGFGEGNGNNGNNTGEEDTVEIVLGCTNPNALNFNASANQDDESCLIQGCTDPSAINFNPEANQDFGCEFEVIPVTGCTDPTAFNFNPEAEADDGSCIEAVLGCTNPNSLNFNENANTDDGSCVAIVQGCTDPTALNYNPLANVDFGCVFEILGCTNPSADNHVPNANVDDGSCEFCGNFEAVLLGTTNPSSPSASNGTISASGTGGSSNYDVLILDGNDVQQNPFELSAGTYTVVVTDLLNLNQSGGFEDCIDSFEVTLVAEDNPPPAVFAGDLTYSFDLYIDSEIYNSEPMIEGNNNDFFINPNGESVTFYAKINPDLDSLFDENGYFVGPAENPADYIRAIIVRDTNQGFGTGDFSVSNDFPWIVNSFGSTVGTQGITNLNFKMKTGSFYGSINEFDFTGNLAGTELSQYDSWVSWTADIGPDSNPPLVNTAIVQFTQIASGAYGSLTVPDPNSAWNLAQDPSFNSTFFQRNYASLKQTNFVGPFSI